jgi:hypothetical protein
MAYSLALPSALKAQGWKVKIRDKERTEPPHVSVLKKTSCWRYDLREGRFLDKKPPPSEVVKGIVECIENNIETLIAQWDGMYPDNPVSDNENKD